MDRERKIIGFDRKIRLSWLGRDRGLGCSGTIDGCNPDATRSVA